MAYRCSALPLAALAWLSIALAPAGAQRGHSAARVWNEALLAAIREDFARPTVHARNLYHLSLAAHEVVAAYDGGDGAQHLLLGRTLGAYASAFDGVPAPADRAAALHEAVSYASYRLLRYRFRNSPGRATTRARIDSLLAALGYDPAVDDLEYASGGPAALGNYVADQVIRYGLADGANDQGDYANLAYEPVNDPLVMDRPGNPDVADPDRWQPLSLTQFVDQAGNPIPGGQQDFLGPEWGGVVPFAMDPADATTYERDGYAYRVYHDPGPPPLISDDATRERYQSGFEMVARWSGLLDPADGVVWDVSPGARGRHVDPLPASADYYDVYDEYEGGDTTGGLRRNPATGKPYAPNLVPRGDYGRVLAEFWADGPDSETPPGHWFSILNYVMDQPGFTRRWRGQGPELDALAYDVRAYLTLGGAMHDAAVSTWGVKGRYDYPRPVSAIRYMAERGQRTDPDAPHYHPHGLALEEGYFELIEAGDPLAGPGGEYVGDVKLWGWLGPDAVDDPATDVAGVGWIRAKEWWPYQRPTFVSPPFAGYVSGHSTFSRAAAEVLTDVTGSAYFPGGLGTFTAPADAFLVFEEGPSETVELQWATYRDASDEVSLSRIFGGIHPPADDIPGRRIGIAVAADAVARANELFDARDPGVSASADVAVVTGEPGRERVTVTLDFDEAVDSASFAWALPPDLPAGALSVERAGWRDGLARRRFEVVLACAPLGGATYADVYLGLAGTDLAGNPLAVERTPGLFDLGEDATPVADDGDALAGAVPNPASGSFVLRDAREVRGDLRLFDAAGREVRRWPRRGGGPYSLAGVAPGVYALHLEGADGSTRRWRLAVTAP